MRSLLVLFLLLCSMAVCQIREYIYIPKTMIWDSAQRYCRENYVDLATITTDEESQRLLNVGAEFNLTKAYVGLKRAAPGSDIWQWSDGESYNFFKWWAGQPDNYQGKENCGDVYTRGWNDINCAAVLPFFCSWRFVLVKDSKTWDEALDYCRRFYTGLASPVSPQQRALAKNATAQTQTARVWTGVRFLDGQWASVSSTPLGSLVSLASCPAPHFRCGALNTGTNVWENRDCSEKLNFLCY